MFVAQNDAGKGTVTRHKLYSNFTNMTTPILNIDTKEAAQVVYTGGIVNGLTVNELLGVLLVADTTGKKITAYEYDEAILKHLNKTAPFLKPLVQDAKEASDVFSVAVYKDKEVVWGNHANGKTNGAVIISSNTTDPKTYKALTKDIDGVVSVVSEGSAIYYVDTTSKVYRARHHDGKFEIDMVHDKVPKIRQIAVLDKYIYMSDNTGFKVLKTSTDLATKGYQLNSTVIDVAKIDVKAFTIFRAGAHYLTTMFGTLFLIVSLTFF